MCLVFIASVLLPLVPSCSSGCSFSWVVSPALAQPGVCSCCARDLGCLSGNGPCREELEHSWHSQLLWIYVWTPFVSARANCALCWQAPLILLAAVVSAQLRDVRGHCQEGAGEIFQVHRFLRTAEFYCNLTLLSFDDPGFVKYIQEGMWMMLLCH